VKYSVLYSILKTERLKQLDSIKGAHGLSPIYKSEVEDCRFYCVCFVVDDQSNWRFLPDCSQLDDNPGCVRIGLVPLTTIKPGEHTGNEKGLWLEILTQN